MEFIGRPFPQRRYWNGSSGSEHSGEYPPGYAVQMIDLTTPCRVLVVLDRYFSTLLGRACGLRDEE